jgi:hypothetical protein
LRQPAKIMADQRCQKPTHGSGPRSFQCSGGMMLVGNDT